MGWACYLHDTGVQKLTLNMLCPFLTSPGEGRPQHYITSTHSGPSTNYPRIYPLTQFLKFTNMGQFDINVMMVLVWHSCALPFPSTHKWWKQIEYAFLYVPRLFIHHVAYCATPVAYRRTGMVESVSSIRVVEYSASQIAAPGVPKW